MPQRPGASPAFTEFNDFITRASTSPDVVGLVLSGSQARHGMATARSDHDVYVITAADSAAVPPAVAEDRRSPALDVMPLSLSEFRTYALHQRVRPYDKYLPWELEHHPLGAPQWAADALLPRIRRVVADGDLATQRALFATVERAARQAGHATVLDSWGTDIDLLRPDG